MMKLTVTIEPPKRCMVCGRKNTLLLTWNVSGRDLVTCWRKRCRQALDTVPPLRPFRMAAPQRMPDWVTAELARRAMATCVHGVPGPCGICSAGK